MNKHLKGTLIILASAAVILLVFFRNQDNKIESHFKEVDEIMKTAWIGMPYEVDKNYRDVSLVRFTSNGKHYYIDFSNNRKIYGLQGEGL